LVDADDVQASFGKAEEELIPGLYRRRIRVPAETWSVSAAARSPPTGPDAERFRGVVATRPVGGWASGRATEDPSHTR
jgi:hypothetical protein